MFSFWKDSVKLMPIPKENRVGKDGVSATDKPVTTEIPLKDLVAPVPKGQKYGAE